MCNDYELNIDLARLLSEIRQIGGLPPPCWTRKVAAPRTPLSHVRIADRGLVLRLGKDCLRAEWLPWAWEERDERIFNLRCERRVFAGDQRCLVPATGYYEYSLPAEPQGKLPDQHVVRLGGQEWFWMPAIVKRGAFAIVTTAAGADLQRFSRRQACILPACDGMAWLALGAPAASLLKPSPQGSLEITTLRKDTRREVASAA